VVKIEGKVIAIGDIHGQTKKLKSLWKQIQKEVENLEEYSVVFLGDYVDRGPDTKGTLEFLVQLQQSRPKTYFICGNHDFAAAAFLGLIEAPPGFSFKETWKDHPNNDNALWDGKGFENMHLQGRYLL
jgi:predicted MPP superfamily phosphohydrolase